MQVLQWCLLAALLFGQASGPSTPATPPEEFNGPFNSWHRVQCGGQDDTPLLQNELNALGRPGGAAVLYIAPGTCRITATLTLSGVQYVSLLGHDPADTRIVYAGAPGAAMLGLNGVGHSRFGRLTWDGGGLAGSVYFDAWVPPAPYFPTALRHEDEAFKNLQADGVMAYLGASGGGTAETTWIRDSFIGPADAGVFLANYNVLDQWVWDSVFDSTTRGVTNFIEHRANGSGGFAVNRSTFLRNSEADLETGNVAGPYGDRWNYSRGSGVHAFGQAIGSPAPGWTAQGNVVLDTPVNPISLGHAGPLGLLDNIFRGGKPEGMLGVQEAYSATPTGDLWAIGNTFSNTSVNQYAIPLPGGRLHGRIDDTLGANIADPGYSPPQTPPATARPVFEPASADSAGIQAAVDRAAVCGQPRCVVHLPASKYTVSKTISVPDSTDLQVVGDGPGATILEGAGSSGPILVLNGPSRAVIRDLLISGQGASDGLFIRGADQPGGLIHAEDIIATGRSVGLFVDNVARTSVDLLDFQGGGESATAGSTAVRLQNGARVAIFNGALGADTLYDVRDSSQVIAQTVYEEGLSQRPVNVLAPGGSGTLILDSAKLQSYAPGVFDAAQFGGSVTIVNIASRGITFRAGSNFLGLGVLSDTGTLDAAQSPFAWWEPRQVDGAGSKPTSETSAGILDPAQFLRDHLAPLRAAKPVQLGSTREAGATDVRLTRVFIETATTALHIAGGS